jgi:hypothetical protein
MRCSTICVLVSIIATAAAIIAMSVAGVDGHLGGTHSVCTAVNATGPCSTKTPNECMMEVTKQEPSCLTIASCDSFDMRACVAGCKCIGGADGYYAIVKHYAFHDACVAGYAGGFMAIGWVLPHLLKVCINPQYKTIAGTTGTTVV